MQAQAFALKEGEKLIRFKPSDGGCMIYPFRGGLWTLTQKYFKQTDTNLALKYSDWELFDEEKHGIYKKLLDAVEEGNAECEILGRLVLVMTPLTLEQPEETPKEYVRSPVTEAALRSAGQVAEALGKAIACYIAVDRSKADAAHKELLWVAKNVGWETKANRHVFESRWPNGHPVTEGSSSRESESCKGPDEDATDPGASIPG